MIEISTDDSGSVSEPVFGSDIERESKSDFKRGSESVFDFDHIDSYTFQLEIFYWI